MIKKRLTTDAIIIFTKKIEVVMEKNTITINEKTSMLLLAGPIFIEMLLGILLNNVDTLMLSRYSQTAVGAVGNSNQILNLFIILFGVIAGATGVVVSQYLGAKQIKKMNQIYTLSTSFNLILGLIVSGMLILAKDWFINIMNIPQNMREDAKNYITFVGGFLFLQAIYNVMIQILRCNGHTKTGMYISLIVNVINIIGNYMFLYGPLKYLDLGVRGVAISTILARTIALIIAVVIFYKLKIGKISILLLKKFPFDILVKMFKIGIPSSGENMAYSFYQIILLSFINNMGDDSVNAKVYANMLMSFSIVFALSVAQATQIVTGHLVGAKKEDEAYKRVWRSLKLCIPVSILIAILNCLLSPFTLSFFTENKNVISLVQQILAISILMEIGRTTNLVVIGSMKSAGDFLFPVLMGLFSMWIIGIGVGYGFGVFFKVGVAGIFLGTTADECLRGIIMVIRWKKGSWRNKAIV